MVIQDGYIMKDIVGNKVIIPIGQNIIDNKSILHLNESGAYILNHCTEEITYEELLQKLIEKYASEDSEKEVLQQDLDDFLAKAKTLGVIV